MASSDDEGETLAESVTNYHFVDHKDEPISFSVLPIQWYEGENLDFIKEEVFLNGVADDGGQKIYKQVMAWKFELLDKHPEVSVLSKENNWIKLLKPRKSFEDTVRTILITVYVLYFAKKHPEAPGKSLWDRLWKVFSSYEVRPCESDLLHHLPLIRAAIKQDEALSKSKFLMSFLENPMKKTMSDEDVHAGLDAFIVDDEEELDKGPGAADEGESDEEAELFDSVCAICDNGGELLCCEGRCIRSFHPTEDAGEESDCMSLGLSKAQVKAMQNFVCLNCQYKRHQCFACGKLGSSDKSVRAEVFHCVSATCGYFYHPDCVAKLLYPTDDAEAEKLQKGISEGESFTCPAHKCHICKQGENKDIHELQFAVCRRCPRAYHRKCLPRKIAFDDLEDEDIITRAWDGLLPNNRVLIYCLKHKIDEDLGTPARNHIVFPSEERKKTRPLDLPRKRKAVEARRSLDNDDSTTERNVSKVPKHALSREVKHSASMMKKEKLSSEKVLSSSEKFKRSDVSRKAFRDSIESKKSSEVDKSRVPAGEERPNRLEPIKSKHHEVTGSKYKESTTGGDLPLKKQTPFQLDAETKNRILTMMERKKSSITLEDVMKTHMVISTHQLHEKRGGDKSITLGKVEGSVEAVRTALKKLEEGGSIEDARAVCGPEILYQISKWKNKLKVYLAPFLHGMRYTSYGRHFTKVNKLKEIVDKLHWYTKNDDMIVDFCCGANDFSLLMSEKLEETGKRCSFKNFDVIQPKNDFCFEKRDWMTVRPKELPKGDNLIMGLNPPFGVKASLANKFVDKALEFKPKLIILIVPPETERLDRKKPAYDLIWEDNRQLSGKSFYLPGSVDVNDNQMEQWNVTPPPLYLWSRSDWTHEHKAIALKQGHLSKEQTASHMEEKYNESQVEDMDISPIRGATSRKINLSEQNKGVISPEVVANDPKGDKESFPSNHDSRVDQISHKVDSNHRDRSYSRKSRENKEGQDKGKESRPMGEVRVESNTLLGAHTSEARGAHSDRVDNKDGVQLFQPDPAVLGLEHRTAYKETSTDISETLGAMRHSSEGVSLASGVTIRSMGVDHSQGYGVQGGRTGYTNELDEYRREADVQQLLRQYGSGNLGSQNPQVPGRDAGFGGSASLFSTPYRLPGSAPESSFGRSDSSAMQRYAPRLDELNPSRMSGLGSQRPPVGGSAMYSILGSPYVPGSGPSIYPNMSGFAPGPRPSYPPQNSSGWLDD